MKFTLIWTKNKSYLVAWLNKECVKISNTFKKKLLRNLLQIDRQTHKGKTVYTPLLRSGGIKISVINSPVYIPGGRKSPKKGSPRISKDSLLTEFLRGPLYVLGQRSLVSVLTAAASLSRFQRNRPSSKKTWKFMSLARVPVSFKEKHFSLKCIYYQIRSQN